VFYTTVDFLSLLLFTFQANVTRSNRHGTHGLEFASGRQEVAVVVEFTLDTRLGHRGVTPDEARRGVTLGTKIHVLGLGAERIEIAHVNHVLFET
jgi:hypothetical protein